MMPGILMLMMVLTAPIAWILSRKRKFPLWAAFAAAWLLGSLLYVGSVWAYGLELKQEMLRFDLDGDGEFSDTELTPEANAAIKRFTTDTGRNFAPIVAPIAMLVWTVLVFLLFWLGSLIRNSLKSRDAGGVR